MLDIRDYTTPFQEQWYTAAQIAEMLQDTRDSEKDEEYTDAEVYTSWYTVSPYAF